MSTRYGALLRLIMLTMMVVAVAVVTTVVGVGRVLIMVDSCNENWSTFVTVKRSTDDASYCKQDC